MGTPVRNRHHAAAQLLQHQEVSSLVPALQALNDSPRLEG